MNGILVIDKPAGITSHDVVARVRKRLGTRRVGHTGTLDPFATGVMVVLVGNATRLAQFLDKDEKEYVAEMRFGFETDTGDVTGGRSSDGPDAESPRPEEVERALPKFLGAIEQTPPMYSAKKIEGRKLYELAREGKEIERKKINVTIRELALHRVKGDTATIRVICSAGTYIRTLAEDIARSLGSRAHLTALRRTRSGRFDLGQSIVLDDLSAETRLVAANSAVSHLSEFVLSDDRIAKTRSGLSSRTHESAYRDGEFVRIVSTEGELLAVGVYVDSEKAVQPRVVLS